jgi:hypothetical protein
MDDAVGDCVRRDEVLDRPGAVVFDQAQLQARRPGVDDEDGT